jgi:DNA invertase Pin-like site-specific DNA recombinase
MKRVVLYLRVSTIDQTTVNQERELREVASRIGCEIVRVIDCFAMPLNASSTW